MRAGDTGTTLRVRLTPRGGRNSLTKLEEGVLHARVAAAPVDGAANLALLELLAAALGIARGRVSIVAGEAARQKAVRVEGLPESEIAARIGRALA
jgi:uncharacterized protein YggU (UPF0235/DUF167 family)